MARSLSGVQRGARDHLAPPTVYAQQITFFYMQTRRVARMQLSKRLDRVRREAWRFAGAGQRVPVISHPAGVEHEGIGVIRDVYRRARRARDETRIAAGREITAVLEEARSALRVRGIRGPLRRLQR